MTRIRYQPSLARDFRFMVLALLALCFTVMVWVASSGYHRQVQVSLGQVDADALRVERHMLLTLENTGYVLESLGRQITRKNNTTKLSDIHGLLTSFSARQTQKTHVLSWIDRRQALVVSNYAGVLARGVDVSDRDYVKKAVAEPWRIHIGRPIQGRVSDKWVLPMSMGITDEAGDFVGVLLMAMDVMALTRELQETLQTRGLHVAVTNRAYTLILEADNSPLDFAEQTQITQLLALDLSNNRRHVLSYPSLIHPDAFLRVLDAPSSMPLRMFYTMHPEAYMAQLVTRVIPRMAEILAITLFLLLLLWNVRRRVIQPVQALTGHTSDMLRGTSDALPAMQAPLEVLQLREEIMHLCEFVKERGRVSDEMRDKMQRQQEQTKRTQTEHANYQAMATGLLQDLSALLQDAADTPANKAQLTILREIRPLLDAKTAPQSAHEKSCDTSLLVKRAINEFNEHCPVHAEIILDTRATMPWMHGNEARLSHMLVTLLRYEAEQIQDNPRIEISASIRSGAWWLSFSREAAEHESPSGAIGLALARAVMALHEGDVDVKHAPSGKRSITLRFPSERVSK